MNLLKLAKNMMTCNDNVEGIWAAGNIDRRRYRPWGRVDDG